MDIPIKGNINERKEAVAECVDKIRIDQLNNNKEPMSLLSLLKFWLIPIYNPNNLFVPNPSITKEFNEFK